MEDGVASIIPNKIKMDVLMDKLFLKFYMPFFKYIFSKKHRPFSGFTVYRERAEILFIFVF